MERVLPRELEDSEENERLVGVATSEREGRDGGRAGTGVKDPSDDWAGTEVIGDTDAGMVLMRPTDEGEPLGLKKEVSKEVSTPSCRAIERTDGEGIRIDDS